MNSELPIGPGRHGTLSPGRLDRLVIAATSRLPDNWLGLRLAIGLRRLVTMRGGRRALDVERWGLRMRLHPHDNGCEKNLLFTPQMYEAIERDALAAAIARASADRPFVFVDVGANVGLFSLFVAAKAGTRARIIALEPEPGTFARLTFNVDSNAGLPIQCLRVALGEAEGEVATELDVRDRGGATTRPATAADAERVPCRTLMNLLREQGIDRIDALKIDVEGAEDRVLAPFFRDAPAELLPMLIVIEDSRDLWDVDLFALMERLGYRAVVRSKQNAVLALAEAGMGPGRAKPPAIA